MWNIRVLRAEEAGSGSEGAPHSMGGESLMSPAWKPEENLFLMNLWLCGSSLASLGPCPELRLWGWHGFHTWTSTGQLRAQQGKQDTTWPPVWEERQCFSFPASPIQSSILVLLALGETCLYCWALQEGKHANSCSLKVFSYLLLAFVKGLQYFDIFLRV